MKPLLKAKRSGFAEQCFEAAKGDPLIALDIALKVLPRLLAHRRARALAARARAAA